MPGGAADAQSWLSALLVELAHAGIDPSAWLLGAARLAPSVLLIPAFGLRALPAPARLVFAFALAASVLPAFEPLARLERPWLWAVAVEVGQGLPVAVGAASTLWAASMAGNLIDQLGSAGAASEEAAGPFGILLSLASAAAFFELGGAERVTSALCSSDPLTPAGIREVVRGLIAGIDVGVLLLAPVLVLLIFLELFQGLLARATGGLSWAAVTPALRSLVLLAALALVLDRLLAAWQLWSISH
ncbi:MAG TPA: flagellar biosynthetic protein FliR [Polyangiaceae bacterium]|nr:flagellar biosynthetic protein FliR [Polyangiaceae bacterium]